MDKKMKGKNNRRKHPRVSSDMEIEVASILFKGEDHFQLGKTKNISCSGIYCNVNKFIIPLTNVQGVLRLPLDEKADNNSIPFKGVVVRTDPEKDTDGCHNYDVAIFFNDMMAEEKQKIKKYLDLRKDSDS